MATITLVIRSQKFRHGPCEESVTQLKNVLPTIIASKFGDSPVLPNSELELFDGKSGNPLSDTDLILGESVIFVFEIFTITPCPLYRTIQPNQIHPVVESKHEDNRWSRMSPLYCGAFHKASSEFTDASPFYVSGPAGDPTMEVRGMSLKSAVPTDERLNLTDPVGENESVGWTILCDLTTLADEISPSNFGKLHTPTLINSDDAPFYSVLHVNIAAASQPRGQNKKGRKAPHKRMLFFAYEMPANTNLEDRGMAVVFDNADPDYPGHFTLIPWKRPLRELLRNEYTWTDDVVLTVAVPNDDGYSIFRDFDIIMGVNYRVFPSVAAQFQFHSMWMIASAAVKEELDEDNDSAKLMLARGVAVFYTHLEDLHRPEDMLPLLSHLISADYDISRMSKRDGHRLISLFESVSRESSLDENEYSDVVEALEVVEAYIVGLVNWSFPLPTLTISEAA